MKCPACRHVLTEKSFAGMVLNLSLFFDRGISVDVCDKGCGGIWFDKGELELVDEADEPLPVEIMWPARNPDVVVDYNGVRLCPRCEDVMLHKHYADEDNKIEVDECPECEGVWLDVGEIEALRQSNDRADDQKKARKLIEEKIQKLSERDRAARQAPKGILQWLKRLLS